MAVHGVSLVQLKTQIGLLNKWGKRSIFLTNHETVRSIMYWFLQCLWS